MGVRAAGIFLASLSIAVLCESSGFATATNSPPHVDTSGVNLPPPYPQTALPNSERGAVVLGVAVTAKGQVTRVSLIGTSGFNDLDASAVSTVLGWKFVPAIKDGSPVEGTTMVKLIFEPPAPPPTPSGSQQPASAAAPQPPPPSSQVLFPAQMTMSAHDGAKDARSFAIPCERGAFEATITVEHDAKERGEMVQFVANLSTGSNSVQFSVSHIGARLVGARLENDQALMGQSYWGSGEMGVPIPISVGWGSGQVTGNGGNVFGQHQISFVNYPQKLEIAAHSGDVLISNAHLVCLPNNP